VREPYGEGGKRDPRWDAAARKALDEYFLVLRKNGDPDGSRDSKSLEPPPMKQSAPGANDPLISYIDLRFATEGRTASQKKARRSLAGALLGR